VPSSASAERPALGAVLLLAVLSILWGLNWPVMKVVLGEMAVLPFRALCLIVSGPVLLAVAALRGGLALRAEEVPPLALAALFNVTLWHVFTGYGVSLMPAGRASLIAYTMPAWSTLLGVLVLGEVLSLRRLLGLGLGMGAIAILILPDLSRIAAAPWGALSMILAALAWAGGSIVMKGWRWQSSMLALTGWQICIGGLPIVLAALVTGPFPGLGRVDRTGAAAIAYVIVGGMLIGQWVWFVVLDRLPVAVASISTLAIPAVGLASSALLLHEALGASEIAALALVVAALALVILPRGVVTWGVATARAIRQPPRR
jgi:drug/metabolite transporter (DMT)-like permease